eukprot:CAMPEP_0119418340 /NCGR_PEP_ID=MMETSP1335-20130426/18007_1 /TAXON_ID=259385 /ORGANISM="Chrysoculter rhomboideus, Strain RCC1486" /LENGTH=40 /DNA_ID= /DNA_START= /DNA_END= /DNA_ORIENTATION=
MAWSRTTAKVLAATKCQVMYADAPSPKHMTYDFVPKSWAT